MTRQLDLDCVTIPDILNHFNIEYRRSRCRCPIHGGDNQTAFSFTDEVFQCFACGAKGGKLDLIQELAKTDRLGAIQIVNEISGVTPGARSSRIAGSQGGRSFRKPIDPRTQEIKDQMKQITMIQNKINADLKRLRNGRNKGIDVSQATTILHSHEYDGEVLDAGLIVLNHELNQRRRNKSK